MRFFATATKVGLLSLLPSVYSQDTVSYDYDTYGTEAVNECPTQSYMSNTLVQPPEFQINKNETGLAEGLIFIGVDGDPNSGQDWPTIFEFSEERMGSLVWTGNFSKPMDFKTQTYKDQPVLTFWSGELMDGYGRGSYYILNQSYIEIAHFQVDRFGDNMGDIHEFSITDDDTALIIIYHALQWNLTETGGVEDGWLYENTFQELNIETGEAVFEWNATAHVAIDESYNSLPDDVGTAADSAWDFFHMNAVQKDANGDYLVSGRVMDCVFKISGEDGSIIWRLNGKKSDFEVEDDAVFAFQHDARWVSLEDQTRMTLFDNNVTYSRGLLLDVNQDDMTVKLIQEFTNGAQTWSEFEGSLEPIDRSNDSTNYLLGYGNQPYFAELNANGDILLDVQFGKTNAVNAYRTYRMKWQGKPLTIPDIHWNKNATTAYFSWNGQTDCEEWIVYTANATNSSTWTNVTTVRRTGFETTVDLTDVQLDTYVRGKAVNGTGAVLGWTQASDGTHLYDVQQNAADSSSTTTTSTGSASAAATSSTSNGVAARATQGIMGQVYLAAVVVVGALALL